MILLPMAVWVRPVLGTGRTRTSSCQPALLADGSHRVCFARMVDKILCELRHSADSSCEEEEFLNLAGICGLPRRNYWKREGSIGNSRRVCVAFLDTQESNLTLFAVHMDLR